MDIKDFKIDRLENSYGVHELSYKPSNKYQCCIFSSPTANCQLYSIGNADVILYKDIELRRDLFKFIQSNILKKMVLLDIQQSLESRILEVFNICDIIARTPYKSTSSSDMLLLLLKTNSLDPKKEIKHENSQSSIF